VEEKWRGNYGDGAQEVVDEEEKEEDESKKEEDQSSLKRY
jgi:hypothetical protein